MKDLAGLFKSMVIAKGKNFFREKFASNPVPFKTLFSRFREALDNHNRAIEIIADMGDKLGGDYIFDINYIKSAYSELYGTLSRSLSGFDILTQNKYPHLKYVFNRIDGEIRRLVYNAAPAIREMVLFYEDITWSAAHEVGGKNANLAELKNTLKFNVPAAFAITTHAFEEFMKYNNFNERIEALNANLPCNPPSPPFRKGGPGGFESELKGLQDLIINAEMPPELDTAINKALGEIKTRCGDCFLAVRSSADEEDSEFSFAGQFETVLNVPLDGIAVKEAYKKVIASMFSVKAEAYARQSGYDIRNMKMAAGCLLMVDATVSGVIYSTNPNGNDDALIINATWGLGKSIVEGRTDSDFYSVKKKANPEITGKKVGRKISMIINRKEGGTSPVETPAEMAGKKSLTDDQALELAGLAMQIEKHFRRPQDIEWAIDKAGRVFVLQSRPLRIMASNPPSPPFTKGGKGGFYDSNVLMKAGGIVVQNGAAAGRVFMLQHMDELDNFPKGAVLVARHDSSDFIRIMPYVSAIITDVGTPTSHMASLCREFRVPTVVNTGDATSVLQHGQEITVSADDEGGVTVYEGIIRNVLEHASSGSVRMEDLYEFRKKRYVLRYISPLNLVDPLLDSFVPERCKTMHDILRFIHEKSVMELVEGARSGLRDKAAVKLELPIPAGIAVVDIGGGLSVDGSGDERHDRVTFEQVDSIPFRAVLQGMMYPGAWHSDAVSLKANDFLASMMRMPDIVSDSSSYIGYNVAVISREYMNLSLRFGYHFNMMDCYCSENTRNNHIYFRFTGGATDIVKRSRRIQLIGAVLKEYGFNLQIKGDLIIARLSNIRQDEMERILNQTGRLIAYTRQLDAVLHDDSRVELYASNFLRGNYEL